MPHRALDTLRPRFGAPASLPSPSLGDVWGLRFDRAGVETVAALAVNNRGKILDALSRIRFGKGQVIITTLRIFPELGSKQPQSAAPKKLFLNMME